MNALLAVCWKMVCLSICVAFHACSPSHERPKIDPALFASTIDMVEDIMQQSLPGIIDSVKISDYAQGSNPLRIISMRGLPDQPTDKDYPKEEWCVVCLGHVELPFKSVVSRIDQGIKQPKENESTAAKQAEEATKSKEERGSYICVVPIDVTLCVSKPQRTSTSPAITYVEAPNIV